MDAVQRTAVRDPLLITKREPINSMWIWGAVIVLTVLIFGKAFI